MFFIIGIFTAIFLSLLLLIKKNKSQADKILVLWLLFISINQLSNYLHLSESLFQYPHWLGFDFALPITIGVFLFFYVSEITGNSLNNLWKTSLHFLPTVALIVLAYPFYQLSGEEKIAVYKNHGIGYEWYTTTLNLTIAVSGLFYAIWSLILIKKHRLKIQDSFSNTDRKELNWLRLLTIGFAIIWIISAFFDNSIIFTFVVGFVLILAVFGINQLNIFNSNLIPQETLEVGIAYKVKNQNKQEVISSKPTTEKYEKSGLNEDMASEIYSNLNKLVNENAIYKNEELTLVELAKQLHVHPNHLSQVINEMEGKNFYNYINSLRINEFIKMASLPENKKYTMISLAYDCGFSTKPTFNKHFKLVTGKTPTEFFNS